jgi:hypothetical protein
MERRGSKKKGWYDTHSAGLKKENSGSPTRHNNFSITYNEDGNGNNRAESPGKMLD